jgi:hypothetical protein
VNKVTMLFQTENAAGKLGGFSETWYRDGTIAEADTATIAVSVRRCALLPAAAKLIGVRIQQIGGKAYNHPQVSPGTYPAFADIPQMALNIKAYSSTNPNTKTFQIRGIPDSLILGGIFNPAPPFPANFATWVSAMASNQFCFKAVDLASPPVEIISILADGTFVLGGPLVYAVGDYIQLLRVRSTTGKKVTGKFYVKTRTDAQNGVFANWGGLLVTGNGKARKVTTIYPRVSGTEVFIREATTRKVGRPFALFVGRRSKR